MENLPEIEATVELALHRLTPCEEEVVKLRFGLNGRRCGVDEIAGKLDVTRPQALAIEARALRKLRTSGYVRAPNVRDRVSRGPATSLFRARRSSSRSRRRGDMEDRELVQIAVFKLQESAKRIAALAGEAAAVALRGHLTALSHQLLVKATALTKLEAPRRSARAG